ncbi:MAG: nuclear transport factor 2 family protein [Candidatus Dormibacteraeota bacterium]|uniref:Nuclear transport factor 2 family protein n=1 Tax=Candidatus Dormiibacter inghamiae TaxID=3127013 RepID=A0A934NCX3_9BACT|nr:nuclear transport factor 2 family protein [Candidatus Dormibacteraeota bacterium]MBJ7607121.1 nuclear transport factor 2 family protein [Candidatus Dormibacteraeota bacterium]
MLLYKPTGAVHPNAAVVIDGHTRLERGDLDAIRRMFSADIIWHESGVVPPARGYVGVEDVMEYWKVYFGAAGASFQQDIVSIMANDEYATSIVQMRGSKSSLSFTGTAVDVMRMDAGLIVEFWRYYDNFELARAFFSGPS